MNLDKLNLLLERLRPNLMEESVFLPDPIGGHVLFFSVTDGRRRARTVTAKGASFAEAWDAGCRRVREAAEADNISVRWLRVDWVEKTRATTWKQLIQSLSRTKRNYFRFGLSLDSKFETAFLETELNGNAMLYGGPTVQHAVLNRKNFLKYASVRHGLTEIDFDDDTTVFLFSSRGFFSCSKAANIHPLAGAGPNAGRRIIERLTKGDVHGLIEAGSTYLSQQVNSDGRFHYGWHPCFDRPIKAYNALRHASSIFAMLEAWEVTSSETLKAAIDRALGYLVEKLIRRVQLPSGLTMSFLVEENDEIKLGGNAVCLLALTKFSELTGSKRFLPMLERLALGILYMQDPASGRFNHVLNYPTLSIKEPFRIVYYDGEAAFGLMRVYGLTGDERWLRAVENAFGYFIEAEHWKHHDHWLSYCVNELTRYRPETRYYEFGIRNVADYLDFVRTRITTFPTLLELMMATREMLSRLAASEQFGKLLDDIDLIKFEESLEARAHHLNNGHFWPELAMFFKKPERIVGSFFIRHHAFRVRIDDVEHYLSGFVAYLKYLDQRKEFRALVQRYSKPDINDLSSTNIRASGTPIWTRATVEMATEASWAAPPPSGWSATGLCTYAPSMRAGNIVVARSDNDRRGVPFKVIAKMDPAPAAIITSDPRHPSLPNVPILKVPDTGASILAMGQFARSQMTGKIIGVTGSAGKTTTVGMLTHVLSCWGSTASNAHNANLPHGVSWNLASIPWTTSHIALELAIGKMLLSSRIARPHIAIVTNILPAHLKEGDTLVDVARTKSAIFRSMEPGDTAILNRDMAEWEIVFAAAEKQRLNIVQYGRSPESDFQLLDYDPATRNVTARAGTQEVRYQLGAAGEHMALNSLAVLSTVSALGYDLKQALRPMETFSAMPGRGELISLTVHQHRLTIIDDAYNANPGSMRAALANLRAYSAERRLAVLGEMAELGPAAETYHTQLANLFTDERIDRVYVIGELYADLWAQIPQGCRGGYARSLDELKSILSEDIRNGDAILFKGSNSTRIHRLVAWIKEEARAPEKRAAGSVGRIRSDVPALSLSERTSGLLYDAANDRIVWSKREDALQAPASLTKLLTLGLIEQRLADTASASSIFAKVSPAAVNSRWGFQADETVSIDDLMAATAIVSSNEAAHTLAEWHSGSVGAFTELLNDQARMLGLTGTRFALPSGLGARQQITATDCLALARHILAHCPKTAELCGRRIFTWKGKNYPSTNKLLGEIRGADGLKTGTLAGRGNNLVFSLVKDGRRWISVILGAPTKAERDEATRTLIRFYT